MLISELIKNLQDARTEHGDLHVQIMSREYQNDDKPRQYGGGGGGWSNVWHGTIKRTQVSKIYPDQLELVTTK